MKDKLPAAVFLGFSGGSTGEESGCNVRGLGSIPGLPWTLPYEKVEGFPSSSAGKAIAI